MKKGAGGDLEPKRSTASMIISELTKKGGNGAPISRSGDK